MNEKELELKKTFNRSHTAFVISKVLLSEVAKLSAKINNTEYEEELARLKNLINNFKV